MAVCTCTYETRDVRNLALVGHAGAGKTSLTEAILAKLGVLGQPGRVDNGDTLSDFTREEIEHQHSLYATVLQGEHTVDGRTVHLNLIDTPGTPDFLGQALMVLPAVETVAVVINAAAGIEPMARRMMKVAEERQLPRMIVVNRIDRAEDAGRDVASIIDELQAEFGATCLPINLPAENATKVLDCFFHTDGASDLGPVADFHTAILDQVVEVDEDLMETYLGEGQVSPEALHTAFEKALREGHLVPVCFTAAAPNGQSDGQPVGIAELVDVIDRLLPNPLEGNPRPFVRGADAQDSFHASADPDDHVLAHAFHVTIDPFVGKLTALRVHQGTITPATQLFVGDPKLGESKKAFKVGHLYKLQGKQHVEVNKAVPGDLVAIAKVDAVHFDCVLHDSHDEDLLHLKPLPFPEPLFGLAISTPKRGDEQKLADALSKLCEEDPTLRVTHHERTHETVLHGLGELHLRVMLERIKDQYHVFVETHEPKVAYRETIRGKAEAKYRHKKQTGGAGQFGEVSLRMEPLERGSGFEFSDDTFGGSIPKQFLPAIEKGVREAMQEGILAGCPVHDLKVSVFDGKHHPVDSKEVAFIEAGKRAFMEAFQQAKPVLLEPMVEVSVTVPPESMGGATGDLTSKRARVMSTDMLPSGFAVITAVAPLAEMGRYAAELKSATSGRGSFTIHPIGYEPVPGDVQQRVIAATQSTA